MAQARGLICAACGGEFATQEGLADHTRLAHSAAYRRACGEEFQSREALTEHEQREHAVR
jgi:hypothetical protein